MRPAIRNLLLFQGKFIPKNISDLEIWLDASDKSTLYQDSSKTTPAINDSDPVGCWVDKSGTGVDFVGAGTARPLIRLVDNRPCIVSDGINDLLTATVVARQYRTIFIVCRKNTMPVNGTAPDVFSQGSNTQLYSLATYGPGYSYNTTHLLGGDLDCCHTAEFYRYLNRHRQYTISHIITWPITTPTNFGKRYGHELAMF
jgi:hypothetical protein